MTHELPKLPFAMDALAPWIDERTMSIHYGKHHQGYVNKLNAVLKGHDSLASMQVPELLQNLNKVPEEILEKVINLGGGVENHTFFWNSLSKESSEPSPELKSAIDKAFGSMDDFKQTFADAAKTLFGSGWAWLVKNGSGTLEVVQTVNQDSPLSDGLTPLLTLDVWEHAYYLQFQNKRADWVDQFFDYINWEVVSKRFSA